MKAAEAAKKADVSPSTITRWVQAGTLSAHRLASGELEIEESELDGFLAGRTSAQGGASNSAVALAVAEERIKGLEMMVATYQGWLKESEGRLQSRASCYKPCRRRRRRTGRGGASGE